MDSTTTFARVDKDVHVADEDVLATVTRYDPYWGGQLVIGAAILLQLSLADKVTLGPNWLLPGLEALALVGLTMASPHPACATPCCAGAWRSRSSPSSPPPTATRSSCSATSCSRVARPTVRRSIGSGIVLWVTNVLLFGVWYWQLDGGGPMARHRKRKPHPDFLFVQMTEREFAPRGWQPTLIDYLYTSFTNATAFSPTDTMPLTPMAKALMAGQSSTALVTVGLVVARAVNILS